ncbi:MAG: winged helix-turn-helix transcriptional regulator [Methanobacterium sp.]|uniref:ArsR/SmtB family transcription factor n=1 Tax=Methanobacterium sp. TaxID=2164 RepID=UPI003D651A06|nr:winged helix-turn-helix transcriptional regulator [Methanobacterium sp.]
MKTCQINGKDEPCSEQMENLEKLLSKIPSDNDIEDKSENIKALSDPTRLKILYILQGGELCVCEIIMALNKPQSTISHHLNVLKKAGFIQGRKEGLWIHYKLSNNNLLEYIENLEI